MHLSDDQGWRIEIKSWPRLATYGGSTQVGGDKGGYYTQDEYKIRLGNFAGRFEVMGVNYYASPLVPWVRE